MCGFAEIFQGAGAIAGGIQTAQRGRAQATHYERLAKSAIAVATHEAARVSEQNDQALAAAKANAAGSGATLQGSMLDALIAHGYFARVQEEDVRLRGLQQAAGHGAQAAFSRADTRAALTGQGFGAATNLLASAERTWPDTFKLFA